MVGSPIPLKKILASEILAYGIGPCRVCCLREFCFRLPLSGKKKIRNQTHSGTQEKEGISNGSEHRVLLQVCRRITAATADILLQCSKSKSLSLLIQNPIAHSIFLRAQGRNHPLDHEVPDQIVGVHGRRCVIPSRGSQGDGWSTSRALTCLRAAGVYSAAV